MVTAVNGDEHTIGFDEAACARSASGGYEYDTDNLRFVYNSMTTPRQWFDYDMRFAPAHPAQDPGDPVRPTRPSTRPAALNAKASDGTDVPAFILMKKGTPLNGSACCCTAATAATASP